MYTRGMVSVASTKETKCWIPVNNTIQLKLNRCAVLVLNSFVVVIKQIKVCG